MQPRGPSNSAGFTLVELLVGATLSAALMAAVLSTYVYLGRNLARLANQQGLETEARRTLGYFQRDAQSASDLAGTPDVANVTFVIPDRAGTAIVTYAYDDATGTLTRTLTRAPDDSSVQILLRNVMNDDCAFRYYDGSGNPYDNGAAPYTTIPTYAKGIKQVSLQFSTRSGNASSGTLTAPYRGTSSLVVLRNRTLLQ